MESVASDLPDSPNMWSGRLRNRVPPAKPVDTVPESLMSSEASENGRLWDDILRNSSLPAIDDAFQETQEGEHAGSSFQPVARSSPSEQEDERKSGDLSNYDVSSRDIFK